MMRHIQKIKDNNKGMSLVTVIIAVGFVSILTSILMLTTTINFKMKNANVYSKNSFYSAEEVLDEIRVGLENTVSDALREAYTTVLESYDVDDEFTAEVKNELIKTSYFETLWEKLGMDGNNSIYLAMPKGDDVNDPSYPVEKGLYSFLDQNIRWDGTSDNPEDHYGAFLRGGIDTAGQGYLGQMSHYTTKDGEEGIVLKGLEVYYKDPSGFVSVIKTDVKLACPAFGFANNENGVNIGDYAFITDTCLEAVNNKGVNKSQAKDIVIEGSTFAYKVDVDGYNLKFKSAGTDEQGSHNMIYSDSEIRNGGIFTGNDVTLWAKDIVAKSSNVELLGDTRMKDDLVIEGKNSNLTLGGNYTGFGNSKSDPDNSSAILIDGVGTTVNLSGIKRLMLAGRGFVSTASNTSRPEGGADGIAMGESIAVKSDQLMYLIPAECVGVNNETNKTEIGQNPLPETVWMDLKNQEKSGVMAPVSLTRRVSKLSDGSGTGDTLSAYLGNPAEGWSRVVEEIHVPSGSGQNMVYLYMKFKDEASANEYFKRYYKTNKGSVDNYLSAYINTLTIPDGSSTTMFEMASNFVSGGDGKYTLQDYTTTDKPSEEYNRQSSNYNETFVALGTKLTEYYSELQGEAGIKMRDEELAADGSDDNKALFSNLVDEEMLKEVVGKGSSTKKDDQDSRILYGYFDESKTGDNRTIHSENNGVGLIITNGDVVVKYDFEGVIVAKGTITVTDGVTMKSNAEMVNKLLNNKITNFDGGNHLVSELVGKTDGVDVDNYLKGDSENGNISSASLVTFTRWKKD